jgi:hypothetical protein
MNSTWKSLAVAVLIAGVPALAAPASAQSAGAPHAQSAAWHGGWHGGWRGGGWGPGAVVGGIVGGAVAAATSPFWGGDYGYYGPGYAYDYSPGYSGYGSSDYAYAPDPYMGAPAGGSVAYCAQRFRSYDPASGTYMGYDGIRHSCP